MGGTNSKIKKSLRREREKSFPQTTISSRPPGPTRPWGEPPPDEGERIGGSIILGDIVRGIKSVVAPEAPPAAVEAPEIAAPSLGGVESKDAIAATTPKTTEQIHQEQDLAAVWGSILETGGGFGADPETGDMEVFDAQGRTERYPGALAPQGEEAQPGAGTEGAEPQIDPVQQRMMMLLETLSEQQRSLVPEPMSTTAMVLASIQAGVDPEGFYNTTLPLIRRQDALQAREFQQEQMQRTDMMREIGVLENLRRLQMDEEQREQEQVQQAIESAQIGEALDAEVDRFGSALPSYGEALAIGQQLMPTVTNPTMRSGLGLMLGGIQRSVGDLATEIDSIQRSGLPPSEIQLERVAQARRDADSALINAYNAMQNIAAYQSKASNLKPLTGKAFENVNDGLTGLYAGVDALSYFLANGRPGGPIEAGKWRPDITKSTETLVFNSKLQLFNAPTRKFYAGTAVTEGEAQRNSAFLPEAHNTDDVIENGLQTSLDTATRKMEWYLGGLERAGYDVAYYRAKFEYIKMLRGAGSTGTLPMALTPQGVPVHVGGQLPPNAVATDFVLQ